MTIKDFMIMDTHTTWLHFRLRMRIVDTLPLADGVAYVVVTLLLQLAVGVLSLGM